MNSKETIICISGDFYLDNIYPERKYFSNGILEIFNKSDFNIINLESPITTINENKIIKTGPYLKGSPFTFTLLKQLQTNLITLANNHIMDYGITGLLDTISMCKKNSIDYIGAGISIEEAQKPFIFENNNTKIAFLNFAENEWSIANKKIPGANPLNLIENVRIIRKLKELTDFVVVIIHGGHEFYNLPSPRMVDLYRFYAENGASLIVSHHSHCISGYEEFKGTPIFYGIGNFLFTLKSIHESWYTGLILKIRLKKDSGINWELLPVKQEINDFYVSVLKDFEKKKVINDLEKYSLIISNEDLLLKSWECYVNEKYHQVIDLFSPIHFIKNWYLRGFFRKIGINSILVNRNHYKQILNNIRCESHSDLAKNVIEKFIYNDNSNS